MKGEAFIRRLLPLRCMALAAGLASSVVPALAQSGGASSSGLSRALQPSGLSSGNPGGLHSGGLHFGFTLPVGSLGATMQKTVDNTAPATLVPEPRRGRVFHDEVSGGALTYGIGAVAGYRLPLSSRSFFLDAEIGAEWHGGATRAQFAGVGVSPERKQLGESWPDTWRLEKGISYGATVRAGGTPGWMAFRSASLHLLAAVRFTGAAFTNSYHGCFSTNPCQPSEFESGTEGRDFDFVVWKAGIGLEKPIGSGARVRAEASYSVYVQEDWVTPFDDVGVTVYSSIKANEMGLAVGLSWQLPKIR